MGNKSNTMFKHILSLIPTVTKCFHINTELQIEKSQRTN